MRWWHADTITTFAKFLCVGLRAYPESTSVRVASLLLGNIRLGLKCPTVAKQSSLLVKIVIVAKSLMGVDSPPKKS